MELIILCSFEVNCSQRTRCTEYCVRDAQEPKPLAERGNILAPRNLDRQAPQALRVFRWLLAAVPPRSPPSPGSSLFWNSQGQRLCAPGPALQNRTPSCLASASTASTDTFNSSNSQRPPVPGYGVPQVQRRPHFRPFSASCDIMSAEGGNNRDCTASQPPSPVPVTNPVVPTPGRISIDMTLPEPSLLFCISGRQTGSTIQRADHQEGRQVQDLLVVSRGLLASLRTTARCILRHVQ